MSDAGSATPVARDGQVERLREENAGLHRRIAELEHRLNLHEVAARIVHVSLREDEGAGTDRS